jgi:membrane-bound metal-dependent hydrolase YbcI (DUF457 family)
MPLMMAAGFVAGPLPDLDLRWASRWHRPVPGSPCGLFDHRGPTHSIAAAVVVLVLAGALFPSGWPQRELLAGAFAAGYASHLVADALSPMGEPFLWPLLWQRFRLVPWPQLRIPSGMRLLELPIAIGLLAAGVLARLPGSP